MNLPWDRYEYSEPFLVKVGSYRANYFAWRRNARTGQYKLKRVGPPEGVETEISARHIAPNPLELFPPIAK